NLPHLLEINDPRISRGASSDHLWLMFFCLARQLVVIDALALAIDSIVDHRVKSAGKIRFVTVREMAPVGQVHRQNTVAGLQDAEINHHVGLAAAMRLNIYVLGAEQLLG